MFLGGEMLGNDVHSHEKVHDLEVSFREIERSSNVVSNSIFVVRKYMHGGLIEDYGPGQGFSTRRLLAIIMLIG